MILKNRLDEKPQMLGMQSSTAEGVQSLNGSMNISRITNTPTNTNTNTNTSRNTNMWSSEGVEYLCVSLQLP